MKIKILQNIMDKNLEIAGENRRFFSTHGVTAINIMASPGAGKTSIILKLSEFLLPNTSISVIEGDIASNIDAKKLEDIGIPVVQINTCGGCHLDSNMIREVLGTLHVELNSFLFIENVGNLVCPSVFDLGETLKLVIASVPEGDDKPYKYISMFEAADIIVLNKVDFMQYTTFNTEHFTAGIRNINQHAPIFQISCTSGQGIAELHAWLMQFHKKHFSI